MTSLYTETPQLKPSPFSFDNCTRNAAIEKMGCNNIPTTRKTGTTICAALFKDGVVMGCDSRATEGNAIADKSCIKLHRLTDSIYACGAGTAADLDQVGRMLSSQLTLLELNTGRKARVAAALRIAKQHLFKYQGYVGAYLIIGGVDFYGPKLVNVHASGGSSVLPYLADGSGCLAAYAVLETGYKENMTREEAVDLVGKAVQAGMHGDLNSGNSYCMGVITKEGTETTYFTKPDFVKAEPLDLVYRFKPNSTTVLKRKEIKFDVIESMEVDVSK